MTALLPVLPSLHQVQRALVQRSLSHFIQRGWRYMDPSAYRHNWHIDAISEHLMAVSRGQIRHLLINIPPRCMKSLSVCVAWPAWTWAQDADTAAYPLLGPQVRWLFSSYAQTLSVRDSVKCRRLLTSPWYQRLFGDRFMLTGDQNTKLRFDNDQGGYRIATSVDGALTGEGGDILVVDDPHNVKQAESDQVRLGTITWWDEAMSTRLNDPKIGCYVIIMQRLHDRDLSGHVLAKNHPDWTHLCLPMRYEPDHPHRATVDPRTTLDEPLWESRMPTPVIQAMETAMGSYAVAGQFQQRPAPRSGGLFKRHWFPIVKAVPAGSYAVRAWDLAATDEEEQEDPAWTATVKLWYHPGLGKFTLSHVERMRASPLAVESSILHVAQIDGKHVPIFIPQDPGQAGKAQSHYMIRRLAGYIIESKPETGSKTDRALAPAVQAEAGNVALLEGPWNAMFLDEVCLFPNSRYKDMTDAFSSAFHLAMRRWPAVAVAPIEVPLASPFSA